MTEDKKQEILKAEPKAESKAEFKPEPKAEPKAELKAEPKKEVAAPEATPEAALETGAKKNKKIGQMAIKEVEDKLNSLKEKMGGFGSRYASELLKRKEVLLGKK